MPKIRCLHEKTLYNNDQNGYCVAAYKTSNHGDVPGDAKNKYQPSDGLTAFTAVGNRLPTAQGTEITLEGDWVDGKYGKQLSVSHCAVARPQTPDGMAAYLASDLIKGIGEQTAKVIVAKFGADTFDVIENTPKKLLEIPGITENKLQGIMATYNDSKGLRDVVSELSEFGVSPKKAAKIQEVFGLDAAEVVRTRTYALCGIAGFGFKTVDEIAQKKGVKCDDWQRICEGIVYTLTQAQTSGHLFMYTGELCDAAVELLKIKEKNKKKAVLATITKKQAEQALLQLVLNKRLQEKDRRIYLPHNYKAEMETAGLAKSMTKPTPPAFDLKALIAQTESEHGVILASMQKEAVLMALSNNFSIITGGPGTGKTTVVKTIFSTFCKMATKSLLELGKTMPSATLFVSPTGRASRRLSESVGFPAQTIHSALGMTESGAAANTELPYDFVVVDESSMMDMQLAHQLFRSLKPGTKLLLVGDYDQLPSVGAGNVFREMILCGEVPVTRLDMVYRQANTSRIHLNAHSILQNRPSGLLYGADFGFIDAESSEEAAEIIKTCYFSEIKEHGADGVQILSPMRSRGHCASDKLNKEIQAALNPKAVNKPEITVNFKTFRLFDKVMQTRNNGEISNGDVGRIRKIEKDANGDIFVAIDFGGDRKAVYSAEDMESVNLAYAATIHKSQGSEYPVVIIPMLMDAFIMLQRNLIYTAITRAKGKVIIVGQKKAFFTAIHKTDTEQRNTVLGELIKNA